MCLHSGLNQLWVFICLYTYQYIYWNIYSPVDVVEPYIFGWFYFLPHKWSLLDPVVSDLGDLSFWSHSLMTHNGALPSLVRFSQLTCLWMSPTSNIMWAGEPDYALSGFPLERWWWWEEHIFIIIILSSGLLDMHTMEERSCWRTQLPTQPQPALKYSPYSLWLFDTASLWVY